MPSPTGVTKLVRKKKRATQGKRTKREARQNGTWNYLTMGFPGEAPKKAASSKS